MRTLSCAQEQELAQAFAGIDADAALVRAPEFGLVLVAGRVGATGSPFGLGEMTVTRCVVQFGDAMGVSYVRGRVPEHARMAAVADALLQGPRHDEVVEHVLVPLRASQDRRHDERAAAVETSRVQFVTMVRGD